MRAMGFAGWVIAAMGRSYEERCLCRSAPCARLEHQPYSNCSCAYAASSASIASSGLHLAAFS
jgi:hypothetical protein